MNSNLPPGVYLREGLLSVVAVLLSFQSTIVPAFLFRIVREYLSRSLAEPGIASEHMIAARAAAVPAAHVRRGFA